MEISEFSFDAPAVQTYLITGPKGAGKLAAAGKLAQAMVCAAPSHRPCGVCRHCQKAAADVHPDVFTLKRPEGKKDYTVEQIREICADASVLPNEAERKVYIIPEADTLNPQSQNAFLKTLEEPPAYVSFLLTAENPGRLLPTVFSRCTELILSPVSEKEASDPEAEELLRLLMKKPSSALLERLFALDRMEKSELSAFCVSLRHACHNAVRSAGMPSQRMVEILSALDEAEKYLDANVNVGNVTGLLLTRLVDNTR